MDKIWKQLWAKCRKCKKICSERCSLQSYNEQHRFLGIVHGSVSWARRASWNWWWGCNEGDAIAAQKSISSSPKSLFSYVNIQQKSWNQCNAVYYYIQIQSYLLFVNSSLFVYIYSICLSLGILTNIAISLFREALW